LAVDKHAYEQDSDQTESSNTERKEKRKKVIALGKKYLMFVVFVFLFTAKKRE
jgi:hypothetical protein